MVIQTSIDEAKIFMLKSTSVAVELKSRTVEWSSSASNWASREHG
jgi:hypothetical protein